ncbi:MAG: TIGR04211 family SH3 domain-containing protein [Desulfobacula sp.]|jgi:SH3 domain protein|nr:TIGR04211 family SH3 domain-containing protein [Desulfobacula sp.]
MKKSLFYFMIFIAILFLLPPLSWAKTGYVSDRLILNFRQEPDSASAVIKPLKSDDPVFILEEKNEFYKVELESKEIGWVEKKFIIFELPKTLIIDQLKQENNDLKDKISELSLLEADLKKNVDTLLSDKDIKSNDQIENTVNIQKIVQENQMYQEKNLALSQELALLKKENKNLFKTSMIKWFLSGVGVLLLGWIIGQGISSRKRKSSSSLLG